MAAAAEAVLPLEEGQRLTRDEFLRRYEAMPYVKKAELIRGVVHMASPVSRGHGVPDVRLAAWLEIYSTFTPGTEAAINTTWMMLEDAPQPDGDLRILPEYGGASGMEGNYAAGAPELLTQVSRSTSRLDLGPRLDLYWEAGVQEYLVYLVTQARLLWHVRGSDTFEVVAAPTDGIQRSRVFPGLWLDVPALLREDRVRVFNVLQEGLQSPEHAAFVAKLASQRASSAP